MSQLLKQMPRRELFRLGAELPFVWLFVKPDSQPRLPEKVPHPRYKLFQPICMTYATGDDEIHRYWGIIVGMSYHADLKGNYEWDYLCKWTAPTKDWERFSEEEIYESDLEPAPKWWRPKYTQGGSNK